MRTLFICSLVFITHAASAQWAVSLSNQNAADVLDGSYNPVDYAASTVISDPSVIINDLLSEISADSLEYYNQMLTTFGTRHTLSDTISNSWGIGAARRWIHGKFMEFDAANEDRLEVGYLNFKYDANLNCPGYAAVDHKNVVAVLPGADPSDRTFLLVEAHMDSRCDMPCDTTCVAPGVDDNGSGTALVMELTRVMSQYTFDHTIVFTTTTGEEMGLWGAEAWAFYIDSLNLDFRACFNNDIVGGILCGPVASPPACATPGSIDSTSVRVFSFSPGSSALANSPHKQFARYINLQQLEVLNPIMSVPMAINIMLPVDRTGRGGDHQPFTDLGYTAVRFTSTNEHGDGSGGAGHLQHTTDDTLVDFNYLARNTTINGVNMALLAGAPDIPNPSYTPIQNGVEIQMTGPDAAFLHYRVGVRDLVNVSELYWDTVYTFTGTTTLIINDLDHGQKYYFSVMNVDVNGVESLPADEFSFIVNSTDDLSSLYGVQVFQNNPDPATESTDIIVEFSEHVGDDLRIVVRDLLGRKVDELRIPGAAGQHRVNYERPGADGTYFYTLVIDGQVVASRKMLFN